MSTATKQRKTLESLGLSESEMETFARGSRHLFADKSTTDDDAKEPKAALEDFEPVERGKNSRES